MRIFWPATITLASALCAPLAHAGFLEALLARPSIQALLGRQPDLQITVKNCANAAFRPVSYTHLDVYKRQIENTIIDYETLPLPFKDTPSESFQSTS